MFFRNPTVWEKYFEKEIKPLRSAADQLSAYFRGELKEFSFPLDMGDADFVVKDWRKMIEVPYGKMAAYKDIALGNLKRSEV